MWTMHNVEEKQDQILFETWLESAHCEGNVTSLAPEESGVGASSDCMLALAAFVSDSKVECEIRARKILNRLEVTSCYIASATSDIILFLGSLMIPPQRHTQQCGGGYGLSSGIALESRNVARLRSLYSRTIKLMRPKQAVIPGLSITLARTHRTSFSMPHMQLRLSVGGLERYLGSSTADKFYIPRALGADGVTRQ